MNWPEPVTLRGNVAVLAPLGPERVDDLREAVRDGELWRLRYTSVPEPNAVRAEIERRLSLQRGGSGG
jgi:N-acetyltransferase